MVDSLMRLGFSESCIVETILVTLNTDGSSNPAPMGVTRQGEILHVETYKTSRTFQNLLRGSKAYINVTDNPLLFLNTAFKNQIKSLIQMEDQCLTEADAIIVTDKLGKLSENDLSAVFSLTPNSLKINNSLPTVFSRGRSAAIEAIIHTTRIQVFHKEGRLKEVQKLVEKVKENNVTVQKVSSGESVEIEVMEKLVSMIKRWGVEW